MKKRIAAILALVLAISLCACAAETSGEYDHILQLLEKGDHDGAIAAIQQLKPTEPSTEATSDTPEPEPSAGEKEQLRLYNTIARALRTYADEGSINIWDSEKKVNLEGSEALEYCCRTLKSLEAIDKWLETDQWVDKGTELDREKLIRGFDIVEDVLLVQSQTVTDNLGNVSANSSQVRWHYNGDDSLSHIEGGYNLPEFDRFHFSLGTIYYMYDVDGSLLKLQFGSDSYVTGYLTPTYDDQGRLVSEYVQTNDAEYVYRYTYDDAGRVKEITWRYSADQTSSLSCTYDSEGRVIKTVLERVLDSNSLPVLTWTREYTYDDQGHLASAVYTETGWGHSGENETNVYQQKVDTAVFQCDDQGRVIKETITPGVKTFHDGTETKPDYTSQVLERTYGSYYHYNPLV